MAYIDLTKITDIDTKDIIANDPDLVQLVLDKAEMWTRKACRDEGVKEEDIPFGDDGFLQSELLRAYCEYKFLFELATAVRGSYEIDDIYARKIASYGHDAQVIKDSLEKDIIIEVEVVDPAKRDTGIKIL